MDPTESLHADHAAPDARSFDNRNGGGSLVPRGVQISTGVPSVGVTVQASVAGAVAASTVPGAHRGPSEATVAPDTRGQEDGRSGIEGSSRSLAKGLVRLARPRQWIKNLLVFVAPAAGGVLLHGNVLWHASATFGIFCIAASGTYLLNDAIDAESDRLHPTKCHRPVATGMIPVRMATTAGVAMLCVAVGLGGMLAGRDLAIVMGLYAMVNVAYSLGLKDEPILDLVLVSAGFVLRAVAGGVATGVVLSNWFLIVASFGSLLVVTGKRSGEKELLTGARVDHGAVRQTLGTYTPEFLRTVRTLSAAVTVTAYCLWAFERGSQAQSGHHPIWFQLTIVPFVITVLHIFRLFDSGAGAAPEELAIHDHRLQIYGLCWVGLFAVATYA